MLTEAMGISRKSMYAAFGNKEELFLDGAVHAGTQAGRPAGCLGVRAALAVGAAGQSVQSVLTVWRAQSQADLRERFQQAADDGDLPVDADVDMIARYLTTIADGVSVQAAGGASRAALRRVVDVALLHWPLG